VGILNRLWESNKKAIPTIVRIALAGAVRFELTTKVLETCETPQYLVEEARPHHNI